MFLVDSGSSSCFIDLKRASQLSGMKPLEPPVSVQVAGGAVLQCSDYFPELEWSANDAVFTDSFRVLALGGYDGIVGLDWLAKYSPMTTHWAQGWISFLQHGQTVVLHGEGPQFCTHALVELQLLEDQHVSCSTPVLPEVQRLLDQFVSVFQAPSGLPPR